MRDWDEEISQRRRGRGKTAITRQEDRDGESRVFIVQVIYLTTTSIESGIMDTPHAVHHESEIPDHESYKYVESEITDHESYEFSNTTRDWGRG